MSRNAEEQFVYELENINHGFSFRGHDPNILQIVWAMKTEIKAFYPMNQVPDEIMKSLEELETMFNFAEKALTESVKTISAKIQKDEGMVNGRYP